MGRKGGLAVCICAVVVLNAVLDYSPPKRLGQVLFVPASAELVLSQVAGPIGLSIQACNDTPEGLRVVGRVTGSESSVTVFVTDMDVQKAGTRQGMAELAQSRFARGSVGDFDVVLDGVDGFPRFAVSQGSGGSDPEGSVIGCPEP